MYKQLLEQLEARRLFSSIDTLDGIMTVYGSSNDDTITISGINRFHYFGITGSGGDGAFYATSIKGIVINAGDGNDTITVDPLFEGRVTINGQGGDDDMIARSGGVMMDGGAGNDTYRCTGFNAEIDESDLAGDLFVTNGYVIAGSETDTIQGYFYNLRTGAGNDHVHLSTITHFENLNTGAGNDYIVNPSSTHVFAGDFDDTIMASNGDHRSDGGSGQNRIVETAARIHQLQSSWFDLVDGKLRITGTSNADRITVKLHGDGEFTDLVFADDLVELKSSTIKSVIVQGYAGNDLITIDPKIPLPTTLAGNDGNDTIYGGSGFDRITGGDGDDWIDAGAGNDIIYGEAGNDRIFAGAGRDRVDGGSGVNLIRGQDGSDRIAYHAGDDTLGNRGDLLSLLA